MKYYHLQTYEEICDLLSHSYNESGSVNFPLFKGITNEVDLSDYYFVQPSAGIRTSKTVNENGNSYNLMFNNLQTWHDLPRREKSIIVTTNYHTAESFARTSIAYNLNYGKVYRVIPFYDSALAIAPKEDIWYSFQKCLGSFYLRGINISLVTFNTCLKEIFDSCLITTDAHTNWDIFTVAMLEISTGEKQPQKHLSFNSSNLLKALKEKKDSIIGCLEDSFNPYYNGIVIMNYNKKLDSLVYPNNEIWTEGDCILVEEEVYKKRFSFKT